MLNLFPSLLMFGFFAPTIIRIIAAMTLFVVALRMQKNKNEILSTKLPIIGTPKGWMLWIYVVLTTVVGMALFVGYATQLAALLGMVVALKHAVFASRYPQLRPLPRASYVMLFFICLSLLLSGAGAFAFDVYL